MNPFRRFALAALPASILLAACSTAANPAPDPASSQQLRKLLDREEIAALVNRLSVILDEARFADFSSVYTADATAKTPGGEASGLAALSAQASRNHAPGQRIQHFISNVAIDLAGDSAQVRANVLATFAPAPGAVAAIAPAPQFTLGAVYQFSALRTSAGWRLSRVETIPAWSTGTRP